MRTDAAFPRESAGSPFAPALVVVGADAALSKRLGADSFSFDIVHADAPPTERLPGVAVLLPFPACAQYASRMPKRLPFVACGEARYLPEAFALGAADFLREDWDAAEFGARIGKVLGAVESLSLGFGVELRGALLSGPRGALELSDEDAALLRELVVAAPVRISRVALRRFLWPELRDDTRVVDAAVSRLRRNLANVSSVGCCAQIRSVRGFGYSYLGA